MPKLPAKTAKRVAAAESNSFPVVPEGVYVGKLVAVTTTNKDGEILAGPSGPYWRWELELQDCDEAPDAHMFVNTSLSEKADWKMKEVFDAFGYATDSDTDEMVGELVKLQVSQRVIEQGPRKGELGNNVDKLMPYDADGDDDVFD